GAELLGPPPPPPPRPVLDLGPAPPRSPPPPAPRGGGALLPPPLCRGRDFEGSARRRHRRRRRAAHGAPVRAVGAAASGLPRSGSRHPRTLGRLRAGSRDHRRSRDHHRRLPVYTRRSETNGRQERPSSAAMSVERDRPPAGAGIPVLLYHSVADAPPPGQQLQFTVTPARFAEHVATISASGRTPMTISELASGLNRQRALPERPVAVTFDDGFDDTPPAVSQLWAAGISSTVYVTTGNIGTPRGISLAGLAALADGGAELGAHTVSHPHLDELPARAAASEIGDSRRQLEEHLGRNVATFAY